MKTAVLNLANTIYQMGRSYVLNTLKILKISVLKYGSYFFTTPDFYYPRYHTISADDFSIISSGNLPLELLIRESLLIDKFKPVLNENIRSVPLTLF